MTSKAKVNEKQKEDTPAEEDNSASKRDEQINLNLNINLNFNILNNNASCINESMSLCEEPINNNQL